MKRILVLPLVLLILPHVWAVSINSLLLNPENYDNKLVTVEGEVIGILRKENFVWINIVGDKAGIGVWCPAKLAENVKVAADYHHRGDLIRVTGRFHAACLEHGGDPDIHAAKIELLSRGEEIPREVDWLWMVASLVFLIISLFLYFWLPRRGEKGAPPYWY